MNVISIATRFSDAVGFPMSQIIGVKAMDSSGFKWIITVTTDIATPMLNSIEDYEVWFDDGNLRSLDLIYYELIKQNGPLPDGSDSIDMLEEMDNILKPDPSVDEYLGPTNYNILNPYPEGSEYWRRWRSDLQDLPF